MKESICSLGSGHDKIMQKSLHSPLPIRCEGYTVDGAEVTFDCSKLLLEDVVEESGIELFDPR